MIFLYKIHVLLGNHMRRYSTTQHAVTIPPFEECREGRAEWVILLHLYYIKDLSTDGYSVIVDGVSEARYLHFSGKSSSKFLFT